MRAWSIRSARSLPMLPVDGAELNPLLQDPAVALHPPFLYMGYVGMSFVFSIAAVWVHDQTTRGTVSGRLDDQDAAINGLIDTTSSLLDEEEASSEWLCEALAVGFGKPITCRSTRGVEKIRREMPRKIHHP